MADPVVKLEKGSVRGVVEKHDEGFNYYTFKGIPYAEPPVGELRFKDPIPKKAWTDVIDCKDYGPMCMQYDIYGQYTSTDEDCLSLNVFTHTINDANVRKPVIVSVHGGSYQFSSGRDNYYGVEYMIRKDIVLVTFNYRVGVLGFLNLEDKVAPGNQGLKDQVMVLQWVQENIQAFGGDPDNVTLCGTFTGGSCAHYLSISPLCKGLFHKVISQGCCVYNTWIYVTNAKETAKKFCSILGKELVDSEEILTFLKTVDTKVLQEAQAKLRKVVGAVPFGPGVDSSSDNPFMPVHPVTAADEGVHVPYLMGYPNRPGLVLLLDGLGFPQLSREESFQIWDQNFERSFSYNTKEILDRYSLTAEQVRRLYYKSKKVSNDNIDNYVNYCSDFYFIEGMHKFMRTQCERSSAATYMYVFDYESPDAMIKAVTDNPPNGAGLGDDVAYIFKMRVLEKMGIEHLKKGSKGYRLMEQMTEMWANFATYGRPTIQTSELIPVLWKPISNGTLLRYLSIDEDITMKSCINVDKKLLSAKSISV